MQTSKKNLIFAVLLVLGLLAASVPGEASSAEAPIISHGTFGGAPYALEDENAVAAYKNEALAIQQGSYISDSEFQTMEAVLISFDGHTTYATDRGGCIYIQTVINGLQEGDVVQVDNNYFYDDGTGYSSFWDQAPYWIQIGEYTHNPTDTILNWLIYSEKVGDEYRLVLGSGEYNLAEATEDLTPTIGHAFKLTRDVKVYRGVTLANPTTSTRGYITSTSEDTSTWSDPVGAANLDTGDLRLIGVQDAYVDDDWAGHVNGDLVDGHIFGQDAFDTIQKGVDGASAGGTVHVAAGTYAEQVTIDKTLSLIGPNTGIDPNTETRLDEAVIVFPASPVIDPGSEEFGLINAIVDDISIDGFTLDGQALPVDAVGINADESNLTVRNNIVKNFDRVGIWSTSYESIDGSWNYNNYNSGILVENNRLFSDVDGRYTDFSGIYIQGGVGVVQGNYVDNARRGIQIQPYNNPDSTQGRVQGNHVKAFRSPLWFNYSENAATDWVFQDNTVEGIPWPADATTPSYDPNKDYDGLLVQTFYAGQVAFSGNTVKIGSAESQNVHMFRQIAPVGGSIDLDATYASNSFEKVVVVTDGTNIIHDTFYTKIQDAINAASAGDTVLVSAGEFIENDASYRDMYISKSLNLIGAGKGGTVVLMTTGKTNGVEIRSADPAVPMDVTIQGISFTKSAEEEYGPGFALRFGETSTIFNSITLRDVEVSYANGRNVMFGSNGSYTQITIEDSDFHHSGVWGISVDGPTSGLTIQNSNFTDNGALDPSHGYGLDIGNGGISNVVVEDSKFLRNTNNGINITDTTNARFTRIEASDNKGFAGQGHGVNIWEWRDKSSNILFEDSIFANNARCGLVLGTQDTYSIDNVTIRSSQLINNGEGGVIIWTTGGPVSNLKVNHNRIAGNTGYGLYSNQPTVISDARYNWWGCNEGPGAEGCNGTDDTDPVEDPFSTHPYLTFKVSADPLSINPAEISTITSRLAYTSTGLTDAFFPDKVEIAFSAPDPVDIDPDTGYTLDGISTAEFTAPADDLDYKVCAALDSETICNTVTVLNVAPEAPGIADQMWRSRQANEFTIDPFTDANEDELEYVVTLDDGSELPEWLIFDPEVLKFSGTPATEDAGEYVIRITASDGLLNTQTTFKLTIDQDLPVKIYLPLIGR